MNILIIDDDADCVASLETALKPTWYKVTAENDPRNALEIYKEGQFDVVITDVRMPGMSGVELMKKLHEYDPSARVIIMTAYCNLYDTIAAVNYNAVAYLNKPFDFIELVEILVKIKNEISSERKAINESMHLRKENENLKNIYYDLMKTIVTVANI